MSQLSPDTAPLPASRLSGSLKQIGSREPLAGDVESQLYPSLLLARDRVYPMPNTSPAPKLFGKDHHDASTATESGVP
ncbi:MAG: hypothetical protein NVS9B13_01160 [Candidatus Acidiferrum sp.]